MNGFQKNPFFSCIGVMSFTSLKLRIAFFSEYYFNAAKEEFFTKLQVDIISWGLPDTLSNINKYSLKSI